MVGGLQVSGDHMNSWTSILPYRRGREFAQDVYAFPKYCENLLRGQLPKHWSYPGNLNRHNIRRYIQLIPAPILDLLNGSRPPTPSQDFADIPRSWDGTNTT